VDSRDIARCVRRSEGMEGASGIGNAVGSKWRGSKEMGCEACSTVTRKLSSLYPHMLRVSAHQGKLCRLDTIKTVLRRFALRSLCKVTGHSKQGSRSARSGHQVDSRSVAEPQRERRHSSPTVPAQPAVLAWMLGQQRAVHGGW
jgi:hypothetical protein